MVLCDVVPVQNLSFGSDTDGKLSITNSGNLDSHTNPGSNFREMIHQDIEKFLFQKLKIPGLVFSETGLLHDIFPFPELGNIIGGFPPISVFDGTRVSQSLENLFQGSLICLGETFDFGFRETQNRTDSIGMGILLDRLFASLGNIFLLLVNTLAGQFCDDTTNALAESFGKSFYSNPGLVIGYHFQGLFGSVVHNLFLSHFQFSE